MEINMMKAEDSKGVKEAADDGDKSIKDIEDADFENRNSDAGSNSTNNISPAASSSSSSIAAKTKVDKKGIANDIVNIKALELSAESEKETDFCGTNKQEKDDIIKVSDEKDLTVADNNEALEDNYYHHSDDNLSLSDKEAHRLRIFKRSRSSSSSSTSSSSSSSSSTSTSSSDYRRRRRHRKKSHRKGRKHGKKSKRSRKYRKSKTRRVSSSDSESDQTPSDNKAKIVKRNKELFPGKMYNYYEDFPNVEKVHPENEVFIDKDVLEKILKESKTVSLLIRDLVKAVFTQEALKGSTAQGYPNRVLGSKKLSRQVVLPRLDPDGRDAILKRAKIEQEKRKQWRPRVGHGSMSQSFSQAVKRCGKD